MRYSFSGFAVASFIIALVACGGKDKKSTGADPVSSKDTAISQPVIPGTSNEMGDTTLASVRTFIEKDLAKWAASFKGFRIDSFHMTQRSQFAEDMYDETVDMKQFYDLYKPSLIYSGDSSQFIDLYSVDIFLEKKGKKIIASADADQAITLCNLQTKTWKRIANFGPSGGIEEAVWTSPTTFILAGMVVNEEDKIIPLVMLGDAKTKSFRWFESNAVRAKSTDYGGSGIAKLKISEWE